MHGELRNDITNKSLSYVVAKLALYNEVTFKPKIKSVKMGNVDDFHEIHF